jgi:hypothetical protein
VALVVEREEPRHIYKVRRLVYYINKVLSDCKTHYNEVQKLLYAILITKCKLLHYFEGHHIHVVTLHGLGEIIGNCLTIERIAKWALELVGLDITCPPNDNQVPSAGGFCSGMDRNTTTTSPVIREH